MREEHRAPGMLFQILQYDSNDPGLPSKSPLEPRIAIKTHCLSNTGPGTTNPKGEKLQLAHVVNFLQGSITTC